jgi:hypothetical protein
MAKRTTVAQPGLFDPPRRPRGRTERGIDAALRDLYATGELDPHRHAALAAVLRVLAHQLDLTDTAGQSYVAATVARTLADLLAAAGAMPSAPGADPARARALLDQIITGDDAGDP